MGNNILIISDSLVEPPSDILAFRNVTMISHYDLKMDILVEAEHDLRDFVYHFMKPKGLMDFVSYILEKPEKEEGTRIDVIYHNPSTIVVKSIQFENQISLLGRIKSISKYK